MWDGETGGKKGESLGDWGTLVPLKHHSGWTTIYSLGFLKVVNDLPHFS